MGRALAARGLVLDRLGAAPRLQRLTVAPPGPGEPPAWICHLERFRDGDWSAARLAAEEKLADPSA